MVALALAFLVGSPKATGAPGDAEPESARLGPRWTDQTVDARENAGRYNDIAVDSSGRVHIVYYDDTDSRTWDLLYATNASGTWRTSAIRTSMWVGKFPSIVSDQTGLMHVAFGGDFPKLVYYAVNALEGGKWLSIPVASGGSEQHSCEYVSIDKSPGSDEVHIIFINRNSDTWSYDLVHISLDPSKVIGRFSKSGRLIRHTGAARLVEVVDSTPVRAAPSLAASSDGIHIFYSGNRDGKSGLIHAYKSEKQWSFERIDDRGGHSSAAADAKGTLHVVYLASSTIRYATNEGGKWQTFDVDDNACGEPSMALSHGRNLMVHAVYTDCSGNLMYAVRDATGWHKTEVKTGEEIKATSASIATDADGYAHISFYDDSCSCLKYATNRPPD